MSWLAWENSRTCFGSSSRRLRSSWLIAAATAVVAVVGLSLYAGEQGAAGFGMIGPGAVAGFGLPLFGLVCGAVAVLLRRSRLPLSALLANAALVLLMGLFAAGLGWFAAFFPDDA